MNQILEKEAEIVKQIEELTAELQDKQVRSSNLYGGCVAFYGLLLLY